MIPTDFWEAPAVVGAIPARAGTISGRPPGNSGVCRKGSNRQLPETFGRAPEEFRQMTEKVRFVPEERGQLPEEFRRTAKELLRGAVKKIFPKIFMRGYGMI